MASSSQGIFQSVPVRVQDEVAHWTKQIAENPLWNEGECAVILQTVQAIEGKHKKDALAVLQERIDAYDGMSDEACFARIFAKHLKYGR